MTSGTEKTDWAWRYWRLLRPGRNCLARPSDRIEAWLIIVSITILLVSVPWAGVFWSIVSAERVQVAEEQAATRTPTTAVLRADPPLYVPESTATARTPATWTSDGQRHSGTVPVSRGKSKGDRVEIWTDQDGQQVAEPTGRDAALWHAAGITLITWTLLILVLVAVIKTAQAVLNRGRYAAWERAWQDLDARPSAH